jgi:acetylglutamate synthase
MTMAMKGKMNVRSNTVINNNIIERTNCFNYLEYTITVLNRRDLEIKMNGFNQMCSTIKTQEKRHR